MLKEVTERNVIIYGAGRVGEDIYEQLREDKNIIGFAVSDLDGNPDALNGIRVDVIDHYIEYAGTATVILALRNIFHESIYRKLKKMGFKKIVRLFDD